MSTKMEHQSSMHRAVCGLLALASWAAAFLLTATLLGRIAPPPQVSAISGKRRFYEQHRDDFDILFVGSSRVFHQIIPADFDAALAAAGHPLRSFNFGQDGMWPPESFYLLRQLLQKPAPRLKWVVLELNEIDGALRDNEFESAQLRYWHDRHHTTLAERALLETARPWPQKYALLWRHERLWLKNLAAYGSGAPLLTRWLWPEQMIVPTPGWTQRAGYRATQASVLAGTVRERYVSLVERWRDQLAKQDAPLPPSLRDELHLLIPEIRRAGAEPVFLISPTIGASVNFATVPEGAALYSFSRPDLYPKLYLPDHYHDQVHLNPKGAALYTQEIARRFIELLEARQ